MFLITERHQKFELEMLHQHDDFHVKAQKIVETKLSACLNLVFWCWSVAWGNGAAFLVGGGGVSDILAFSSPDLLFGPDHQVGEAPPGKATNLGRPWALPTRRKYRRIYICRSDSFPIQAGCAVNNLVARTILNLGPREWQLQSRHEFKFLMERVRIEARQEVEESLASHRHIHHRCQGTR